MKKFFLMLAVALPMFFMASCGDDNDEDLKDDFSIPVLVKDASDVLKFNNGKIYLEWDDHKTEVSYAMKPYSYVLAQDNADSLIFTYDNNGATPIYTYGFVNNSLQAASITITEQEDSQIDFDQYFKDNGYKDITTDDDDFFVYQSKDKVCVVDYGYVKGFIMATWVPADTRADIREVAVRQAETVKAFLGK